MVRRGDLLIGLITLVGGLVLFALARPFGPMPGQNYGAGTLPRLVAVLAVMVGGALVFKATRPTLTGSGATVAEPVRPVDRAGILRLAASFGLMVGHLLLLRPLGFVPASVLLVGGIAMLLGRRWWEAALLAILSTLAIRWVFVQWLSVPLPRTDWLILPGT
jgi:hypothetical protein